MGGFNITNAGTIAGNGSLLTALNATQLTTGTVGTARLGTGTANATTYLRGDGTWVAPTASLPGLASTNIWVGNGSGVATAGAMSGDATLSNTGVLTIGTDAVASAQFEKHIIMQPAGVVCGVSDNSDEVYRVVF